MRPLCGFGLPPTSPWQDVDVVSRTGLFWLCGRFYAFVLITDLHMPTWSAASSTLTQLTLKQRNVDDVSISVSPSSSFKLSLPGFSPYSSRLLNCSRMSRKCRLSVEAGLVLGWKNFTSRDGLRKEQKKRFQRKLIARDKCRTVVFSTVAHRTPTVNHLCV